MRKILIIFLAALLIIAVGVLVYVNIISRDMTIDSDTEVVIEEGSNTGDISSILKDAGLIKNSAYFGFYAKNNGIDSSFKAGSYKFAAGSWSVKQVCEMLVLGTFSRDGQVQVTIIEGLTVKDIAQVLANSGLGEVEKYLAYAEQGDFEQYEFIPAKGTEIEPATRLEGFLFPDTYMIDLTWSEEQIIDMLLDQFAYVWESNGYGAIAEAAELSIYEVITMASIVEKEAQVQEDRPLIAGVFYKRMEMGMKLESCATIQFILGEAKENLLNSDLRIDNRYNSYIYEGLPPGPLAVPGKASIEAALNPTASDYLYFRAKKDGSHRFSTTFLEHSTIQEGDQ